MLSCFEAFFRLLDGGRTGGGLLPPTPSWQNKLISLIRACPPLGPIKTERSGGQERFTQHQLVRSSSLLRRRLPVGGTQTRPSHPLFCNSSFLFLSFALHGGGGGQQQLQRHSSLFSFFLLLHSTFSALSFDAPPLRVQCNARTFFWSLHHHHRRIRTKKKETEEKKSRFQNLHSFLCHKAPFLLLPPPPTCNDCLTRRTCDTSIERREGGGRKIPHNSLSHFSLLLPPIRERERE